MFCHTDISVAELFSGSTGAPAVISPSVDLRWIQSTTPILKRKDTDPPFAFVVDLFSVFTSCFIVGGEENETTKDLFY